MKSAGLTGVRQEIKHLLTPVEGAGIMSAVAERVPAKIVDGEPSSFRVSVYLDTPNRDLAKRGLSHGSQSTKIRVKEYYQLEGGKPVLSPMCFLEVKTRAGVMVEKSRFKAERSDVPRILERGPGSPSNDNDATAFEVFESIRDGRPLTPLFVAHYHRWTFQDKTSQMRITFDKAVSYHLPPSEIYTAKVPSCARIYLPPPVKVETFWVMEVKSLGLAPEWVPETLNGNPQKDYSKFVTGVTTIDKLGFMNAEPDAEEARRKAL